MNGDPALYRFLESLNVRFQYIEHPPAPTIDVAQQYWSGYDALHCKNIFLRNHKGNQHFLVLLPCNFNLNVKELEKHLNQGKLSFASEKRLMKYLNLFPGSVSPFGLIHDVANHVIVFVDEEISESELVSFHPNINTASLIINTHDFFRYLKSVGNLYLIRNLSSNR